LAAGAQAQLLARVFAEQFEVQAGQADRSPQDKTVVAAGATPAVSEAFKQRMKHRNAVEGTQSGWVRGHGLRQARYRGLPKAKLQNYFIGAACNVKRWIRLEAWKLRQTVRLLSIQAGTVPSH
jgi:hypothetical protein